MGWWKIDSDEHGQIVNAVPGRDSADAMYNGDGPADLMGSALRKIDAQYVAAWGRSAKAEELREVFDFCLNGMLRLRESGHANAPAHPRAVASRPECGCSAIQSKGDQK